MENVSLEVGDGGKIDLKDCENVEQPEYLSPTEAEGEPGTAGPRFNEFLERIGSSGMSGGIIVGAGGGRIIGKGDTLYSDTLRVIFSGTADAEYGFSEPIGDGFYITPVRIRTGEGGNRLSISSEREHHWVLYTTRNAKPVGVTGAGDWNFDPEKHRLEIRKTGTSFEVEIR